MSVLPKLWTGSRLIAVLLAASALACTSSPKQETEQPAATAASPIPPAEPALHFPAPREFKYPGKVTTQYDKFKDFTSVDSPHLRVPFSGKYRDGKLETMAYFIHSGKRMTEAPSSVTLRFVYTRNTWQFLEYRPLVLILDDSVNVDLGTPPHDGDVGSDYVLEQMAFTLPIERFLQIANAGKIEGQLGIREFVLSTSHLEAFRDLASRMNPSSGGPIGEPTTAK